LEERRVSEWLSAYGDAWQNYDSATIGDLFSEDVSYRYHPYDEPVRGRAAVVASWLEERDAEGTYEGAYEPLVVAGDIAIATGTSTYKDGDESRIYDNCFILRFDDDGRCSEFTEWYMRRPDPTGDSHPRPAGQAGGRSPIQ
jgi:ketosteroid isomerase-like protein